MLIVLPATKAVVEGRDQNGVALLPLPAVMLAVNQELDAAAARFLGEVRGLHQAWKEDR